MDEELKLAIKAYDEFTAVFAQLGTALGSVEKAEKAMQSSTDAVSKAIEVMQEAIKKTGPPLSDAEKAAREKAKADREAAQAAQEHKRQVDGLLQALGALGVLNAVKRGLNEVTTAGGGFEQELSTLRGLTGEATDATREFVMQLDAGRKGVTEYVGGMNELARAGYSARDSMTALPELAVFAAAGVKKIGESSAPVITILKTFQKDVRDTGEVTDVLTMSANRSALGFDDFQLALAMSAGVAKLVGMDYRELISVLSVLRDAGLGASDGGTSLKSALMALMNPSEEAKRVMKDLGIQVYDNQGRMKSWADIVENMEQAMRPLNEQSRNLALSTIFGSDGVRAMALSMGRGSEYIRAMTKDLESSRGATAELAHEMGNNFNGAMQRTQANLEKMKVLISMKANCPS